MFIAYLPPHSSKPLVYLGIQHKIRQWNVVFVGAGDTNCIVVVYENDRVGLHPLLEPQDVTGTLERVVA